MGLAYTKNLILLGEKTRNSLLPCLYIDMGWKQALEQGMRDHQTNRFVLIMRTCHAGLRSLHYDAKSPTLPAELHLLKYSLTQKI